MKQKMSRYYKLVVRTENTTKEELRKILVDKFGWEEEFICDDEFVGEGTLYAGQGEEGAHEEISKALKKLNPKAKVSTRWTNLEELPYSEFGDNIE